jgi:hypothetical protein
MKEGKAPALGDWVGEWLRLGTSCLASGGGARRVRAHEPAVEHPSILAALYKIEPGTGLTHQGLESILGVSRKVQGWAFYIFDSWGARTSETFLFDPKIRHI